MVQIFDELKRLQFRRGRIDGTIVNFDRGFDSTWRQRAPHLTECASADAANETEITALSCRCGSSIGCGRLFWYHSIGRFGLGYDLIGQTTGAGRAKVKQDASQLPGIRVARLG